VDILTWNLDQLERWFLMLFRIGSMLMVFPFYGYETIPVQIRMAFAFFVTVILFPLHGAVDVMQFSPGVIAYFGIVLKEVIVGLAIGFSAQFLFIGVQFAGQVVGRSMGYAIMNVVDPQTGQNMQIIGQLLQFLVLMIFILINGHHFLIRAIDESFLQIPIGGGFYPAGGLEMAARLSADLFVIGIKVAAPVLVAILVAEFALGVVARTVPQMNVWLLGFPLKIGIGLITISLSLPMLVYLFGKIYAGWQGNIIDFIRDMATG